MEYILNNKAEGISNSYSPRTNYNSGISSQMNNSQALYQNIVKYTKQGSHIGNYSGGLK